MECPHCADDHGPTLCRPALALKLADSIHDHHERDRHEAALELRMAAMEERMHDLEAEAKQWR